MTITILGMSCQHCVESVREALLALDGVTGVQVDLESGTAELSGVSEADAVKAAVEGIGFEVLT